MHNREITLTLPADGDFVLLARMTMSGLGMLAGLEVGLIDDLRSAVDESCDCLLHQPTRVQKLELQACVKESRLYCRVASVWGEGRTDEPETDAELTRAVLETLMPDVTICSEVRGISSIAFSLPITEGV